MSRIPTFTTFLKQSKRQAREVELGARQRALPDRKYGVVLADPPWRFEVWSEGGMDRSADNHYPTSVVDAICAINVPAIAADDCVLFLWATAPMLPEAMVVMTKWDFDYKSHLVWDKMVAGTGYWSRNRHELLLIGTRGNIPAPAMGAQSESLVPERRGAHSAKPEWSLQLIEAYFPTLPKIELFRRGAARPGWDAWGWEAE